MDKMSQAAHILVVSCQKGPTRHAYAWQIGPFWQDTLDLYGMYGLVFIFDTSNMKSKITVSSTGNNQINVIEQTTSSFGSYFLNAFSTVRVKKINFWKSIYRQVCIISRTLVGNWNADHSDVVGASPVGAAPTTSSFPT